MYSQISRLWFDGWRGVIRHDGAEIRLDAMPPCFARAIRIDYVPALYIALIQPFDDRARDMTQAEMAAAMGLLRAVKGMRTRSRQPE